MAVFDILVDVVLTAKSGMPKDNCLNTFTFLVDAANAGAAADACTGPLTGFYNTAITGDSIATHIAPSVSRATSNCRFRAFDITADLSGTPHGPPVRDTGWTLGTGGTTPVTPAEVALALSFSGDLSGISEFTGGTRPRARHRGRVFIGPLVGAITTVDADTSTVRPVSAIKATLLAAGNALRAEGGVVWSVWSRRNAAIYEVTDIWCDDAFDTIRSRGPAPTTKTHI